MRLPRLPKHIDNIFLRASGSKKRELPYRKFRSNECVFASPHVDLRLLLPDAKQDVEIEAWFGERKLKLDNLSRKDKECTFSVSLMRGQNRVTIKLAGQPDWDLVIFHKTHLRNFLECTVARNVILVVAFITFIGQNSYIPSASMMNTLIEGDYIFVNKSAYHFRSPKRGDIVVFNSPLDPSRDFIKRLIGLPGDRLRLEKGILYLNGQALKENFTRNFYLLQEVPLTTVFASSLTQTLPKNVCMIDWPDGLQLQRTSIFARNHHLVKGGIIDLKPSMQGSGKEKIPLKVLAMDGDQITLSNVQMAGQQVNLAKANITVDQKVYDHSRCRFFATMPLGIKDQFAELTVPDGEYFVMGDNRDGSQDSRFWGFVTRANLKGQAFFRYMPINRFAMLQRKYGVSPAANQI